MKSHCGKLQTKHVSSSEKNHSMEKRNVEPDALIKLIKFDSFIVEQNASYKQVGVFFDKRRKYH